MNEYDATETAYKNGYKKAVRDVFAEIDAMCIDLFGNFNHKRFVELKKKYTGKVRKAIAQTPTEYVVERPPCKIGDTVWTIRNFSGTKKVVCGKVSEMFFTDDMRIAVVVKHITRGFFGKNIFGTQEEAEQALKGGAADG